MKRCPKCERLLPIKQFNKNRSTKDGLQSWCRACVAAYRAEHKVEKAAYQRTPRGKTLRAAANVRYRRTPKGKAAYKAANARQRIKHPLKKRCRQQISNAITAGKIKRQPCMNGCKAKAEAHHSDYSKPFDVIWLCRPCHRAWHATNK